MIEMEKGWENFSLPLQTEMESMVAHHIFNVKPHTGNGFSSVFKAHFQALRRDGGDCKIEYMAFPEDAPKIAAAFNEIVTKISGGCKALSSMDVTNICLNQKNKQPNTTPSRF